MLKMFIKISLATLKHTFETRKTKSGGSFFYIYGLTDLLSSALKVTAKPKFEDCFRNVFITSI